MCFFGGGGSSQPQVVQARPASTAAPAQAPTQAAAPDAQAAPAATGPTDAQVASSAKQQGTTLTDGMVPFERKVSFLGLGPEFDNIQEGSGAMGSNPYYKHGAQVSVDDPMTWADYWDANRREFEPQRRDSIHTIGGDSN